MSQNGCGRVVRKQFQLFGNEHGSLTRSKDSRSHCAAFPPCQLSLRDRGRTLTSRTLPPALLSPVKASVVLSSSVRQVTETSWAQAQLCSFSLSWSLQYLCLSAACFARLNLHLEVSQMPLPSRVLSVILIFLCPKCFLLLPPPLFSFTHFLYPGV